MTQLIPQALVTLSPIGELQVEQMLHGVRHLIPLTRDNAGQRLLRLLLEQKRRIDGERAPVRAPRAEPDFIVLAKHLTDQGTVEVREMLPGRGLSGSSSKKTPEDLGL